MLLTLANLGLDLSTNGFCKPLEQEDGSDDGEEQMRRAVAHISCMGSDGLEEFPLDWFCRKAEAVDD